MSVTHFDTVNYRQTRHRRSLWTKQWAHVHWDSQQWRTASSPVLHPEFRTVSAAT